MTSKLFRDDNTTGYTQEQLDRLNDEWESLATLVDDADLDAAAKQFCDEVARR